MKKEKTSILDFYEQDEEVTEEEQEEIDSYMDEELENHMKEIEKEEKKLRKLNQKILEEEINTVNLDEYEIEDDFEEERESKKPGLIKKIIYVILGILLILIILSIVDIVCVSKYNKGPFFAIPVHTYDDGGTKEYYGLGYKVIKYNQVQGRRDTEIGTWGLQYNVDPIYVDVLDLAIEFNNDEEETYQKYNNQLLIVSGTLKEIDTKKNRLILSYEDEGEKYSIDVVCNLLTEEEAELEAMEPKYEISAMGKMIRYDAKTEKKRPVVYLENCFADQ